MLGSTSRSEKENLFSLSSKDYPTCGEDERAQNERQISRQVLEYHIVIVNLEHSNMRAYERVTKVTCERPLCINTSPPEVNTVDLVKDEKYGNICNCRQRPLRTTDADVVTDPQAPAL
jgi:hypothetical protein